GNGNGNGNGETDTPDDGAEAELRTYDGELSDDPTRTEVLQHVNGLAHEQAPWVFLHQQFSIYGINDDVSWDARADESIYVREFETDLDEITVSQGQLLETLDPTGENATPQYNIIDQAYDNFLGREDDTGRPLEGIVTDWERTDDLEIELQIRGDVEFHNGNDLDPSDVAFSINRANNPDVSEVADNLGDINEARAEDGNVILDLDSLTPTIFRNLTAFGRVVSESWVNDDSNDISTEINGTGPYELDEYVEGTRVSFTKFDAYWGEEPDPNAVTFNGIPEDGPRVDALISGDSDLITNVRPGDIPDVQEADGVGFEDVPSIRNIFLVQNDAFEPFDSQEFRQAMNFAVDVESIINSILNEFGNQTSQPTLPGHNGHNGDLDPYPHDPERAEALVEASGHAGVEIELHTPVGRYLRDADIAEAAASQIDELDNVSCTANRRDFGDLVGELLAPQDESPAFFLIGWGNPTLDGDYAMSPWFTEGPFQHFNNDEMAELLQQARNIPE
ncbi:ABC transporter substrate-binding protein, partial [Natronomonas sp.]